MSAGTGRRTAISLALLLATAAAAAAALDPPAPEPGKQAPTRWAQYPPVAADPRPLPQITPLSPPPALPVVAPPTVTYQKPAGQAAPTLPSIPAIPVGRTSEQVPVALPQPAQQPPNRPVPEKEKGKGDAEPDKPAGALPIDPTAAPNREEVFRMDSDPVLDRRILKELKRPETDKLPPPGPLVKPGTTYVSKTLSYPPMKTFREPNYVVHRRLYFEERNSERYGWDLGLLTALVSTGYFYADTLFFPHNFAAGGFRERYETSAGKCLPGDPVPYLLYPPGLTPGGLTVEAVVVTGLVFVFW